MKKGVAGGVKTNWFSDLIFRRVFKNAGFLLSGKVATGLFGLAYLSLAARGLGIEQFGILVLVQTYVQVVVGLTTFHSWQAVIRYGAISVENDDTAGFQKLISFTTALDVGGVVLGAALAWFAARCWVGAMRSSATPSPIACLFCLPSSPHPPVCCGCTTASIFSPGRS
jgi:O-antigen/teichoic acid export membrane protein